MPGREAGQRLFAGGRPFACYREVLALTGLGYIGVAIAISRAAQVRS
jgi:hypothetical protein